MAFSLDPVSGMALREAKPAGTASVVEGAWRPHPEVMAQRLDDTYVLFQLQTDRFYQLNRTATRFWELLCAGDGVEKIHGQLLQEFDVDPAELTTEMKQILGTLRELDLVLPEAGEGRLHGLR